MGASERTVEARITGRVQGVSFRWWAREQARSLDLSGWVRNEHDGSVTARISGPAEAVGQMIERLRRGPPMASVRDVEIDDLDPVETDGEFRITG
jgi:acylphosphatase